LSFPITLRFTDWIASHFEAFLAGARFRRSLPE